MSAYETLDPTPVSIPIGWSRPESLHDKIKRLVNYQLDEQAQEKGYETIEEADDFDCGDDDELKSPYELDGMQQDGLVSEITNKILKKGTANELGSSGTSNNGSADASASNKEFTEEKTGVRSPEKTESK